jgi:hypothetical protein
MPVTWLRRSPPPNASITIVYKEFGVRLRFRPVVLGDGEIRLYAVQEVSELSDVGALVIQVFSIPGLITRRGEATLELKSGQSFAMAGLLQYSDAAIDSHLIQTGATGFAEGLDVLLSPVVASEDALLPMQWENLGKAIEACREPYRYVIVDAPRLPQHMTDLAALSHVIVLQLTVRDISFAKSTIALLRSQGVAPDKILPVANRVNRRGPLLRPDEGKDAIGMKSL